MVVRSDREATVINNSAEALALTLVKKRLGFHSFQVSSTYNPTTNGTTINFSYFVKF